MRRLLSVCTSPVASGFSPVPARFLRAGADSGLFHGVHSLKLRSGEPDPPFYNRINYNSPAQISATLWWANDTRYRRISRHRKIFPFFPWMRTPRYRCVIATRVGTGVPQRPTSGKPPIAWAKLITVNRTRNRVVRLIGEGHNVTEFSRLLVDKLKHPSIPRCHLKAKPGWANGDMAGTKERTSYRKKFGIKFADYLRYRVSAINSYRQGAARVYSTRMRK